jgi:hypothetical protein
MGKCILTKLSVLQNAEPEEVLYLTNFIMKMNMIKCV